MSERLQGAVLATIGVALTLVIAGMAHATGNDTLLNLAPIVSIPFMTVGILRIMRAI